MTRREELKAAFKLNRHGLRRMGIFQVKNVQSDRVYLGSSTNLDGALQRERGWLEMGMHLNKQLQDDWNACGADAFVVEALEELKPSNEPRDYAEELRLLYDAWMATLEPYGERGYLTAPRGRTA